MAVLAVVPSAVCAAQSALRCQDLFLLLSSLVANPEVVATAPAAAAAWDPLCAVWRKFMFSAKEQTSLPACATVMQVGDH
jgi:hypothetical protein